MNVNYPYIFGFPDGIPPEVRKQKIENMAFENFLENLLWKESYWRRNQMRQMEKAVNIVVSEILKNYEQKIFSP